MFPRPPCSPPSLSPARVLAHTRTAFTLVQVTFADEEGHGTGVTSEFYSLVSAALQRRDLGMWMCDDTDHSAPMKKTKAPPVNQSTDIAIAAHGQGADSSPTRDGARVTDTNPQYIHRESGTGAPPCPLLPTPVCIFLCLPAPASYPPLLAGLFPAPLPPDAPNRETILERFRFLGTLLAKALLDGRLVSLPLSRPFYKALCGVPIVAADLSDIDPDKARHLAHLHKVAQQNRAAENLEDPRRRREALAAIQDVELYSLTMEYAPSSTMHGFKSYELVPDGANVPVTNHNVHEYVKHMYHFMLNDGVSAQMEAVREGISEVFSASQLKAFTPAELRSMLSGKASVSWTREELVEHLEPRNGYSAESPTFLHLVQVLTDMGEPERKDFLRFATGVCVLPPGGLKNLEPKLTVVRKHCDADPDAHFPSANTCFHFLKLPEYSSQEILRTRLSIALQHGMDGFFFN